MLQLLREELESRDLKGNLLILFFVVGSTFSTAEFLEAGCTNLDLLRTLAESQSFEGHVYSQLKEQRTKNKLKYALLFSIHHHMNK